MKKQRTLNMNSSFDFSNQEKIPLSSLPSPNNGTFYAHASASAKLARQPSSLSAGIACASRMDIDSINADAEGFSSSSNEKSVLDWMKNDASKDVLPKIFSFLGSRKLIALSRVSRTWNYMVRDEAVWKVMCEATHKWSEGDTIPQSSWIQFYKDNPCVPIDYDTVEAAVESISSGALIEVSDNSIEYSCREQRKSSRVLLCPGTYLLRRSLVFTCIGQTEVTIETVTGFRDPNHAMKWYRNYSEFSSPLSSSINSSETTSTASLRHLVCCRFISTAVDEDENVRVHNNICHASDYAGPNPSALLVLESRRQNEPVIRIRQGVVHLRRLKIVHYCFGNDIWNGNAAVQVQSPFGEDDRPITFVSPSVPPTATVFNCDIMSTSGRGFVNIDGGVSVIDNCNIHNSAATGIYVGGAGSIATITSTDVIENGNGNERNRRGVARGHSGIYLEQGVAKIDDCNISKNSLTGISAVSNDHATLQLQNSDIISNGSVQLEMPPIGSPSRGRSFTRNNNISATGHGRPRSTFLKEVVASAVAESPGVPIGGHFPPLAQSPSQFPNDVVVRARSTNDEGSPQ